MATTIVTTAEPAHIGLLETHVRRQLFDTLFFGQFMGNAKQSKRTGETIGSIKPIVMNRRPASEGMNHVLTPMLRNLVDPEIYGDGQAEGNLEDQNLYYHKTYINQRRTGVSPPQVNANQLVKKLDLVAAARPQIEDKLPRLTEVHIMRAYYEGYSENVTTATSSFGLGIAKRYHPNMYASGHGEITWSDTNSAHITAIDDAVQALKGGSSNGEMSARALIRFKLYCNSKQIQPIVMGGMEVRPLLISDTQEAQLFEDEVFLKAQRHANVRSAMANPLFNGMIGMFHGFAIYVRRFSVFGIDTTSTTVTWGASNPLSAIDTFSTKGALCFGSNSLSGAWARGPKFSVKEFDHDNRKEVAVAIIDGFSRAEYFDELTRGSATDVVNQTSAVLLTESPILTL